MAAKHDENEKIVKKNLKYNIINTNILEHKKEIKNKRKTESGIKSPRQ